jgi:hypothetical protein
MLRKLSNSEWASDDGWRVKMVGRDEVVVSQPDGTEFRVFWELMGIRPPDRKLYLADDWWHAMQLPDDVRYKVLGLVFDAYDAEGWGRELLVQFPRRDWGGTSGMPEGPLTS